MSDEPTTDTEDILRIKVVTIELDRAAFPDEQTYQRAVASTSRPLNYSVQGEHVRGIPNERIVEVFQALVDHANPVGMGMLHPLADAHYPIEVATMEWEHALREQIGKSTAHFSYANFDYVAGRRVKLRFRQDHQSGNLWDVDTTDYDQANGSASQVIRSVLYDL